MKCQPEGFSQLEQDRLQCKECSGTSACLSQEVEEEFGHHSKSGHSPVSAVPQPLMCAMLFAVIPCKGEGE